MTKVDDILSNENVNNNLNNCIESLGLITLKSKIIETLANNPDNINDMKILEENGCTCKFTLKNSSKIYSFKIRGVEAELYTVIIKAEAHEYRALESINKAYEKIVKTLCTSTTMSNNKITFYEASEKVNVLKKRNNN